MSGRSTRQAPAYDESQAHSWQPARGDRWQDWEELEERRPRRRARILSVGRVVLFLVVLIAAGVAFYGLFLEQSALQLPLSITGLALLAVSTLVLSLSLARVAAALGRQGSGGRAFLAALVGGFFILGAAGSGSLAVVLALLTAL
jgi:hypothetical protein